MADGQMREATAKSDECDAKDSACCACESVTSSTPASVPYRQVFRVSGLDCAEEVGILRRSVGPVVGGEDQLAFDLLNGRMMVLETAPDVAAEQIIKTVGKTGMTAVTVDPGEQRPPSAAVSRSRLYATILSGLGLVIGASLHLSLGAVDAQQAPLPAVAAYGIAALLGFFLVLPKAWYALRSLRPDMNLLIVVAVMGAAAIGEWFEAATVSFLFALSLVLEGWSIARARRAIADLLDLAPATVRCLDDAGNEIQQPADQVTVGTRFLVKPGDRIPLDGTVVSGTGTVNLAPITGESMPVTRRAGDPIYAGGINGEAALEAESTRQANDTTLARIIRMVEESQSRRARVERWVDRFAAVYTPAVLVLALAIFLVPPMFDGDWRGWFYNSLVMLIIACPCALVISTPVSIVSALSAAARNGILIKGGAHVELPANLTAIAFDKTGTLTRGRPEVNAVVPFNGHTPAELLARAAGLERRGHHPLAEAITRHAAAHAVEPLPATDVRVLPGKGVAGRIGDSEFWLGSHRYLQERNQETPEIQRQAEAMEQRGETVVLVGNDDHVCGLISLSDPVRPEAEELIRGLDALGVRPVMLTGDNQATADAIANTLGLAAVHAELLPEDKMALIDEMAGRGERVAMVGDGVNDAPAMARADLGIAMGAMGSDAAIETADIALMADELEKLPWLIAHSRRTLAVIRQNIGFALGVKALFVVLTLTGAANLWGAIAADVGATLLVVSNAMRLLRPVS